MAVLGRLSSWVPRLRLSNLLSPASDQAPEEDEAKRGQASEAWQVLATALQTRKLEPLTLNFKPEPMRPGPRGQLVVGRGSPGPFEQLGATSKTK